MKTSLKDYYDTALQALGPQGWWPGETPFEVCVGAILTQNTSWKNVERAINNLKSHDLLDPLKMHALTLQELASKIRSAGYFNIKARRLKNFLKFIVEEYDGDLEKMFQLRLEPLREKLLSISGIGPETADSILLYAGKKETFVVDAYTRRIFLRHQMLWEDADYHDIQSYFSDHLPADEKVFNEFHAFIVKVGKDWCRPAEVKCEECPWKKYLPDGKKPEFNV